MPKSVTVTFNIYYCYSETIREKNFDLGFIILYNKMQGLTRDAATAKKYYLFAVTNMCNTELGTPKHYTSIKSSFVLRISAHSHQTSLEPIK